MAKDKAPAAPLKLVYAGADAFIDAYLADPGLGGVFVASSVVLPTGAALDVTVDCGGGTGIRAVGEVMWARPSGGQAPGGMGVRFVSMGREHRTWLDGAIEKRRQPAMSREDMHMLRKAVSAKELVGAREGLQLSEAKGGDTRPILGIDLGTCNCSACIIIDGKPVVVNLADSDAPSNSSRTLPSVVAYDDNGAIVVGARAVSGRAKNVKRTVFGAKRFVGRNYDTPVVQSMLGRFPYKIVPGSEGKVAVEINNKPVSLTTLSAKILAAVRDRAEKTLKLNIVRAVITVPAYYNDNQRNAVVQAGRMAGLTVERILNEPTAAALAYGLLRSRPRRLIVYDLGGGTFDVSVMTVHKDALQILATAGDTFLGGEDFDDILVKLAYEEHFKRTKKPLAQAPQTSAQVKSAAELTKVRLSKSVNAMLTVREAQQADGTSVRLEIEVSRAEFEKRVEPLVTRTLKICDMALREAHVTPEELGDVILVGGQTRMPYVQERVRNHFKMAPRCDLNPDEVVAMGAAMLAHLPNDAAALQDVLSMSIGVNVGGRFKILIPRNSTLPCVKRINVPVPRRDWATYALEFWQGDSPELKQNELLGTLKVDTVMPGDVDPVPVRIDLALTPDCLLKVRVINTQTEQSQSVLLSTRDGGQ